jgi:hypothetical protein
VFREEQLISQTAFALKAGMGRENLAKYESGVVPLPWRQGDMICKTYDIHQRWLVTGESPKRPYLTPSEASYGKARPGSLFSDVYLLVLHAGIHRSLSDAAEQLGIAVECLDTSTESLRGWHDGENFTNEGKLPGIQKQITAFYAVLVVHAMRFFVFGHRAKPERGHRGHRGQTGFEIFIL